MKNVLLLLLIALVCISSATGRGREGGGRVRRSLVKCTHSTECPEGTKCLAMCVPAAAGNCGPGTGWPAKCRDWSPEVQKWNPHFKEFP
ncbi:unnamed protein product, partial [Mesorhabditis belari]|uniref:Uncharacterized protein n=1 Tax=Mesorhabditis belari TaxID=2138241 RepID=A0AAF3J894_9BILA